MTMTTDDTAPDLDQLFTKHAKRPASFGILGALYHALSGVIKQQRAELAELKWEVDTLKARPLQKWAGVHLKDTPYAEASLVTKGGSLWVATTATTATPGEANSDWRLIVKRGDGR